MKPAEYAKAITGGVLAGLGVLYIALTDDVVTAQEWVAVTVATLTTFGTVWGVPNASKTELVTQHVMTVTKQDVTPEHTLPETPLPEPVALPQVEPVKSDAGSALAAELEASVIAHEAPKHRLPDA